MRIGLLSVGMNVYSTSRLVEEAERSGHYTELIDHTRCSVKLGTPKPQIFLGEEDITDAFDAVIPRIGTAVTRHGAAIVKQFEMNGVFSTARSMGIIRARNKVRTLQIMAHKGIPIPDTVFSINADTIEGQINLLGGTPVVIKLQEGTQGLGVILAETVKSAKSIIDTFYKLNKSVLLQKYISESKGEDIRIFVVGDRIIAGMKRCSAANEFRSNVHRGGRTARVLLSPKEQQIALKAAKYLGLGVAGIDLIRSSSGPLLLEVNASPGFRGIEEVTGVNVACAIINYVEKHTRHKKM